MLLNGVIEPEALAKRAFGSSNKRRFPLSYVERGNPPRNVRQHVNQLYTEQRITDRDLRLLVTLYNAVGVLGRQQIERLLFVQKNQKASRRNSQRRLTTLYTNFLLDRRDVALSMEDNNLEGSLVYYLNKFSLMALAIKEGVEISTLRPPRELQHVEPGFVIHDLMVGELYTLLTETTSGQANLRFRWISEWHGSIRNGNDVEVARPDATFVLHDGQKSVHGFLEMERKYATREWTDKLQKYERAVIDGRWRGRFGMEHFAPTFIVYQGSGFDRLVSFLHENQVASHWFARPWPIEGSILDGWIDTKRPDAGMQSII